MLLGMCDFMPATDRAAYDQNDVESDVVAYIIEIFMKIRVRQYVVYVDHGDSGPVVPWFVVRYVMEEMFFVSVWCVILQKKKDAKKEERVDIADHDFVTNTMRRMVGITSQYFADSF